MPPTKTAAPSATEQRTQINEEIVSLQQQAEALKNDVAAAVLAGADTDAIAAKRADVARRIDELEHAAHALELPVIREKRAQLLRNMEAAHELVRQQQAAVDAQKVRVAAAAKALESEERECRRLQNQGSGSFSAQLELKAHREKYPDVDEAAL